MKNLPTKHLCIDARMLSNSGIGTYLKNLIPRLKNDPNIMLSLIVHPEAAKKEPWISSYSLLFSSAPIYSLQEQLQLPRIIPTCDLFWSPHFAVPLLPIRAKKRIVTIHDLYHFAYFSTLKVTEKLYTKIVIPFAVKTAAKVFTISQFSLEEMKKHLSINPEKIAVIPNGSIDKKNLTQQKHQEILSKYNLPSRFFLFVGNCKPHKNIKGLIEAFANLHSTDCYLVIVGKYKGFAHTENIHSLIQEKKLEKRVLVFSDITDEELPVFYSSATAFVFPSFYEGFGLPPLEAMTYGCPVIASSAASIPEVCKEAALYINPYDKEELTKAMKEIENNPILRESLRQKGIAHAQTFSWDITAQKYIKVLHEECFSS
ncbi:MAG: glycosyltransferase family 1 protein [Chlamydiota bacterium]